MMGARNFSMANFSRYKNCGKGNTSEHTEILYYFAITQIIDSLHSQAIYSTNLSIDSTLLLSNSPNN